MDDGAVTYTPELAVVIGASSRLIQDARSASSPFKVILKEDAVLLLRRTLLFNATMRRRMLPSQIPYAARVSLLTASSATRVALPFPMASLTMSNASGQGQ